jgi:hypothetical protein
MGCVYSTVDRRYFHLNVPGGEQYQEINLHPGYQKMCGDQALQFVSYRHNDTSLVRDARDQSFLLDVKKQYGPGLADNVHRFEQIFGQAVQTDRALHTSNGLLSLLETLVASSGRRVRQVQFQATLGPSFDTASPDQITRSVHAFLYGGSALQKARTAAVAHAVRNRKASARLPLVPTLPSEVAQAHALAPNLPFPLEYPRVQDRGGAGAPVELRQYLIHAPDGTAYPAYVAVFQAGGVGQYYDVQGTSWITAPQFDNPDQTLHVAGRTYYLYYEGQKLKMVAWDERGAVYWVRNSLTDSIGNGELLAIAEQTDPVAGSSRGAVNLGAATVPGRPPKQQKTSLAQTLGSLGGLLALLAVPLLTVPLLRRRRELVALRAQLDHSLHLETRLRARVPGGAGSSTAGRPPR